MPTPSMSRALGGTLFPVLGAFYTMIAAAQPLVPSDLLATRRLLPSHGSALFVAKLHPAPARLDATELEGLRGLVEVPGERLIWGVFETKRPPTQTAFPDADRIFAPTDVHTVLVIAQTTPAGTPNGFAALTLLRARDGHREAVIDYIVDRSRGGFAARALALLRGGVAAALGITRYHAEMEWSGRAYWAAPEFGFEFSALQPRLTINDAEVGPDEVVRRLFANFRERRDIDAGDTNLRSAPSHPRELLDVRRRDGERLLVKVLKERERPVPRRLHVGPAFLLSNHAARARTVDRVVINGKRHSDEAMPPWFGELRPRCERWLAADEAAASRFTADRQE